MRCVGVIPLIWGLRNLMANPRPRDLGFVRLLIVQQGSMSMLAPPLQHSLVQRYVGVKPKIWCLRNLMANP